MINLNYTAMKNLAAIAPELCWFCSTNDAGKIIKNNFFEVERDEFFKDYGDCDNGYSNWLELKKEDDLLGFFAAYDSETNQEIEDIEITNAMLSASMQTAEGFVLSKDFLDIEGLPRKFYIAPK